MFLSLQAGIRKGDPRSIEVGVKVLAHRAEMNGYKAPARVDMTGTRVDVLVQQQAAAEAQAIADLDRLTLEELREYRRPRGQDARRAGGDRKRDGASARGAAT
jgi:hypothetical protein